MAEKRKERAGGGGEVWESRQLRKCGEGRASLDKSGKNEERQLEKAGKRRRRASERKRDRRE